MEKLKKTQFVSQKQFDTWSASVNAAWKSWNYLDELSKKSFQNNGMATNIDIITHDANTLALDVEKLADKLMDLSITLDEQENEREFFNDFAEFEFFVLDEAINEFKKVFAESKNSYGYSTYIAGIPNNVKEIIEKMKKEGLGTDDKM